MTRTDKPSLPAGQGRLDLDDLRLVEAVGREGGLAAAARHLGQNHASAWRRLRAIEQRLGVRLFERARAGYAPTPAGEAAVAAAHRVSAELGTLERRLAGQDIRAEGVVRLTTTDTLAGMVMPALASLRASHPRIVVELVTANAFFTLTRRDADVALRPAAAAPEGLVARRLATVATAVYRARGGGPWPRSISPDRGALWVEAERTTPGGAVRTAGEAAPDPGPTFADMDWLAPDEGLAHLGSARWIAANVPAARVVLRASSLAALQEAARAGIGVAALPCFLGDADPGLERVAQPIRSIETGLWLLTHPDLRRTPRVRTVLDALAGHMVGAQRRFEGG